MINHHSSYSCFHHIKYQKTIKTLLISDTIHPHRRLAYIKYLDLINTKDCVMKGVDMTRTTRFSIIVIWMILLQSFFQTILIRAFIVPNNSINISDYRSTRHIESKTSPVIILRMAKQNDIQQQESSINDSNNDNDMNPFTKASWYAVETFGKLFGPSTQKNKITTNSSKPLKKSIDLSIPPSSLEETLERIKLDNDRSYFLSGMVDKLCYDEKCIFSDPFVSFSGRDRFVDNLQNLGSFITKYDAKFLDYTVSEDGLQVKTKVMVKLELALPWKPILAWPWGVAYYIDPNTYLIKSHIESWDIKPVDGVKQIFRKPTLSI